MRLYQSYVLRWVLHLPMRRNDLTRQRARVVPAARGRVLVIAGKGGLGGEIHESLDPQAT